MFNSLKKKPLGSTVTFKIDGMHCSSCSMNIDGELEDQAGVISASTSYAKATTVINYDEDKITVKELENVIKKMGYRV